MNPFDNVGTMRISASFYDRLCRLAVGYQSAAEDEEIVALRTGSDDPGLVADAVALTRATRDHPDVRQGSSVRGAIDMVAVAAALAEIRSGRHGRRRRGRRRAGGAGARRRPGRPVGPDHPRRDERAHARRRSSGSCGRTTSCSAPTGRPGRAPAELPNPI